VQTAQGWLVVTTVVDLTERQRLEGAARAALEERLRVEDLLCRQSAAVVNLPADQVDAAVWEAQRLIGEALHLDRVSMLHLSGHGAITRAREWPAPPAEASDAFAAEEDVAWTLAQLRTGEVALFDSIDAVPSERDRAVFHGRGTRSGVAVPIIVAGQLEGAVLFETTRTERHWPPEITGSLRLFGTILASLLLRERTDRALLEALHETERLRDTLKAENVHLRHEARRLAGTEYVVGQSPSIRRILTELEQVAATDATVLLLGETGTGKELFAAHLHELSARRDRPMVRVHCAAIPSGLIESELFGREKGAYTGAFSKQIGRFELANHSTIFLDEIGELTPDVQVKLLRVLEDKHIERLGSPTRIRVDTRIVAATHRDLEKSVAEGTFREDLYYRLNVFPIRVPPLRERVEDIPLLVWRFVDEFSKTFGKRIDSIGGDSLEALKRYSWPGNIRELRNVVERAMIGANGRQLTIGLPPVQNAAAARSMRLADVERLHILSVLELTRWRIRGEHGAAARLGLKPTTLETRMAKLGLRRSRPPQ
jgi:transcriptional regulator with GAF, ATPase, and Fis domain